MQNINGNFLLSIKPNFLWFAQFLQSFESNILIWILFISLFETDYCYYFIIIISTVYYNGFFYVKLVKLHGINLSISKGY